MAQEVYEIDRAGKKVAFYLPLEPGKHWASLGKRMHVLTMTFAQLTEPWVGPWLAGKVKHGWSGLEKAMLRAVMELAREGLAGGYTYVIDEGDSCVWIGVNGAMTDRVGLHEFQAAENVLAAYRESAKTHAQTMAWLVARDELLERGLIEG